MEVGAGKKKADAPRELPITASERIGKKRLEEERRSVDSKVVENLGEYDFKRVGKGRKKKHQRKERYRRAEVLFLREFHG